MRQIEVRHLYEGAVILDGFRPATVTALENRSPYTVAVRLHSTGDNWTALYSPAAVVLLCVVPAVAWRVHHQQRDRTTGEGKGATHSSSRLSPVHAVRRYWAYGVDHQTVVRLEEEHTVVTSTPITLDQLPGNGQPTPSRQNAATAVSTSSTGAAPSYCAPATTSASSSRTSLNSTTGSTANGTSAATGSPPPLRPALLPLRCRTP